MIKLKLPKKPYTGLKIYCNKCKKDNSKCLHYDQQTYRVRIHIPGSENSVRVKTLEATDYKEAVNEVLKFEKELISNNYSKMKNIKAPNNNYSIVDALIKFNQYLNGQSGYAHLKKNLSKGYKEELIRYCTFFCENLKKNRNIKYARIRDIGREDVSAFYLWAENHYSEKTFNKCMDGIKFFFEFLIDVEEVNIRNPFRKYERKYVVAPFVDSISKKDFTLLLNAVDTADPILRLKGKGEKKDMYRPYLNHAYRLFLLTGCRREEVVRFRWSDIYETDQKVKLLYVENIKVQRIKNKQNIRKTVPITTELMDLLIEMGYENKYATDEYILHPNRDLSIQSLMDLLSKSFTHYWKSTGIVKNHSLKTLRKTYLTWVNKVMGSDTKILSSHSTDKVLEKFYYDPKVLSVIEKGALEIKIFG